MADLAGFFPATFFAVRGDLACFFSAARRAAASAALAQVANCSESSNSRAGSCQYEFTVTVFAFVLRSIRLELRDGLIVSAEIEAGAQRDREVDTVDGNTEAREHRPDG